MALPLVVDGVTFSYPEPGDRGLAQNATDWASAITTAVATGESFYADAGFHAHISVAQTGISGATTIVFDVEDYDDRSGYNPATGIYTVPATYGGDWIFSVSVVHSQVTSAGNQTLTILVNGTAVAGVDPSVHPDRYRERRAERLLHRREPRRRRPDQVPADRQRRYHHHVCKRRLPVLRTAPSLDPRVRIPHGRRRTHEVRLIQVRADGSHPEVRNG